MKTAENVDDYYPAKYVLRIGNIRFSFGIPCTV